MEYPTSHLYFLSIHTSLQVSVYTKKIQVTSGLSMVYHEKALQDYFTPYQLRSQNSATNEIAQWEGWV